MILISCNTSNAILLIFASLSFSVGISWSAPRCPTSEKKTASLWLEPSPLSLRQLRHSVSTDGSEIGGKFCSDIYFFDTRFVSVFTKTIGLRIDLKRGGEREKERERESKIVVYVKCICKICSMSNLRERKTDRSSFSFKKRHIA